MIHPYNNYKIIAGAGTAALETVHLDGIGVLIVVGKNVIGRALDEPVDFLSAEPWLLLQGVAGSVLGRLPKGTIVTGQGTRMVCVERNRSAQ